MYFKKQEIVQKINEISQQRHNHDKIFADLQLMINNNKKYEIVDLRNKFTSHLDTLHQVVKDNHSVLDLLSHRSEQLSKEGVQLHNQKIRIQSLKEYFNELREKIKRQRQRGEEIISARQRWQLKRYHGENSHQDQQQSLLNSHSSAKETGQIARGVLQSLSNQSSRIENVRQKMGSVLKNINFSGNLAQLLRTRTRQDNRLIILLSIGLLLEILLCVFVLKPLYRGS